MGRLLVACALSLLVGCGGGLGNAHGPHGERATDAKMTVSDDAFSGAVRDLLLSEPGSRERQARLGGVEARQMARAADRFKAHANERALSAVRGGLYLLRTKELDATMLGPRGKDAISAAAREHAARGNEGDSRALYEILLRLATERDRKEVQVHLDALGGWLKDTASAHGPCEGAQILRRAAAYRRLLEPSEAALEEADARTRAWIECAMDLRAQARQKNITPTRSEGNAAVNAFRRGAGMLVAIHLRDADAAGALRSIDKAQARELAHPDLLAALSAAAEKPDASKWLTLLHMVRPSPDRSDPQEDDDEEERKDREIFQAAAFEAAIEAYRRDPTLPEAAGAVAVMLEEYGMAEVGPAVLLDAARAHPDARTLGGAMTIALHAMASEIDAQDNAAARRTYRAAAPLLALAETPAVLDRVKPGPAQARAMMGEVELREGNVKEARALLETAVKSDRSGIVLMTLARIERYEGHSAQAVGHIQEALRTSDVTRDPAGRGEALLTLSDIAREQGDAAGARARLNEALHELGNARGPASKDLRARIERVLARVYDRFGASALATKALERAYDASPHDKNQVAATLGLVLARALVKGDVAAAREGLRRALGADLGDDEIVYIALWTRFVEKQAKAPTDGSADKIFSAIIDDGRWIGRLAAFGAGRIKADDLAAAAKNAAQRTEAAFYSALARRAAGDLKGAEAEMRSVLQLGGVDLMEVVIARDILAGPKAVVGGPVPELASP